MPLPDLTDCQCPGCKAESLAYAVGGPVDARRSYRDALVCRSCGDGYDVVWGVPFLGVWEENDVLSLIEVAANADNYGPCLERPAVES